MNAQERENLKLLKQRLNQPKSKLLALLHEIEAISPAQGEKLMRIIARLEDFQKK